MYIAKELGENRPQEDFEYMISSAGGTDGRVTKDQFYRVLTIQPGEIDLLSMYADSSDDEQEQLQGKMR